MKIFFAGLTKQRAEFLSSYGASNFLASFEAKGTVEISGKALADRNDGSLLIDSGAFSAWNSGKEIILKEYIEFVKDFYGRYEEKIGNIYCANLDVIPGVQGIVPTRKQVEEASRQGWDNMLQMEKAGITPIHIFHQGEDFEWLERISNRHRYIGISPSNDAAFKDKKQWLAKVFGTIKAKNMTHGFAVVKESFLRLFPFYSVDSTTWFSAEKFGSSAYAPGFEHEGLNNRCRSHIWYIIGNNIINLIKMQKRCTALWKMRGVVWEEDE